MSRLYSRTFAWRFDRPPEAIWPALADTARFNEAAGLPRHRIDERLQPDGSVRYFASARKGPFRLAWEEIPVEWVWGRWFRHQRVFSAGPLRMLCASLRLENDGDGGAIGHYTVEAAPANAIGALLLATGFFPAVARNFGRLAASARDWAAGRREAPFDARPRPRPPHADARAQAIVARIAASPEGHGLAPRLAAWIEDGLDLDVMRIRPLALARQWDARPRAVIELCLRAVAEGLLEQRWDLLCPRCRGAKLTVDALDRLPNEAHCGACNITYGRDFARNVELTFRPAPAVRPVDDGEFCLFGPMTTPHIVVQARVEAGREWRLAATLAAGAYRLRTLEIGAARDLDHAGGPFPTLIGEDGAVTPGPPAAGADEIVLVNREDRPRTFVIERRDWALDALSAHRATTLQAFRDLFADAALGPGDAVEIAQIAFLFTDLRGSTALYERIGDAAAYRLVRGHFAELAAIVRANDGAIVKTIGDAVMAAFADPADAVRAALAIQMADERGDETGAGAGAEDEIVVKVGVHAGPCVAVTLNERLDYFGSTVNLAARLQGESSGGDVVVSATTAADAGVAETLEPCTRSPETRPIRGFARPVAFLRLRPVATR